MFRPLAFVVVAATISSSPPGFAEIGVSGDDCEVVTILKDGREVRSMSSKNGSGATRVTVGDGHASAVSKQSGSGSSRSSVSVSSSSSGNARGVARAVSSHTDAEGRTVTTTRDEKGCTVVVDERDS